MALIYLFAFNITFRPHYGPGVDLVSNRNEHQVSLMVGKGGRCVGLTALPPSVKKFWSPQPPGTLRACLDLYRGCCTFTPTSADNVARRKKALMDGGDYLYHRLNIKEIRFTHISVFLCLVLFSQRTR